ncbi:lysophospholipase L1-like esterase [Larkinella arboricola]|uniref:Lysophospholipase L1-like esterase n=1 Tax=Larkinella arboricola TaxID=643671 RepID=A0A327WWF1_LARAB|nr:GDSL-type esterase/lipase family protein [Larkinella arboricola]RAJ97469.1 lysophospholipase L1-like esterase [Larkinella arboricola]
MQRRTFLQQALVAAPLAGQLYSVGLPFPGQESVTVINAGIGGNNTVDLLVRMQKDCLAHQPELTILMVGTNDMNSKKYVPLPEYEKNLRQIVSDLLVARSQVMLMTILPVYEPYLMTRHDPAFYQPQGHASRKARLNDTIRKVADDHKLPLLDMHHIFEKIGNVGLDVSSLIKNEANSQKTDGIHPTAEGYRTMAVAIYTFLSQNGLLKKRIVCFGDSITIGDGNGKNYPAYLQQLTNV